MSMKKFSEHILYVGWMNNKPLNNLQLQKVMYLTMEQYIRKNGITPLLQKIYDEPFIAAPYGPLVKTIHHRHRMYGCVSLLERGEYHQEFSIFDEYIIPLLDKPLMDLVHRSRENQLWQKNKEKIKKQKRIEYQLEDIQRA